MYKNTRFLVDKTDAEREVSRPGLYLESGAKLVSTVTLPLNSALSAKHCWQELLKPGSDVAIHWSGPGQLASWHLTNKFFIFGVHTPFYQFPELKDITWELETTCYWCRRWELGWRCYSWAAYYSRLVELRVHCICSSWNLLEQRLMASDPVENLNIWWTWK